MRRTSSPAARSARRVSVPYVGGAFTVSSLGLVAGDTLTIPSGQTWTLDCKTPALADVLIVGNLIADQTKDVGITAGRIDVAGTGKLQIGSVGAPYTRKAVITLTGLEAGRANRFVADLTASSGAGNGRLARLFTSTGAVVETITVTFSSATAFTVSGTVSGSLGAGTVGTLFNNKVRFIATAGGTPWAAGHTRTIGVVQLGFINSSTPRSLQVQAGGKLILIGNPPAITRTTVNTHVSAAASALTIAASTGWNRDDAIVVGPTDFYGTAGGTSERFFLKSKASTNAALKGTTAAPKWGVLQYATDAGMSLTPGVLTNSKGLSAPDWEAVPKVLDQRAPVINLTRNIVVQGADDAAWNTTGFGAHTMYMGLTSEVKLDGVEFRRMGQAGVIGKYPIHWHMLSYNQPDGSTLPSDGAFLGAASGHYIKNCSVHQSSQRAIVIHGTHGILVDSNVCYDIKGHAIFLEDGPEKYNTISNNVVIKVREPLAANKLLIHDSDSIQGSTGYWLSNPVNTIVNNLAADCSGPGIWNSFAQPQCFGLCGEVAEIPQTSLLLLHQGNISHSNKTRGMQTESPALDNKGTVSDARYQGDALNGNSGSFLQISNQQNWKNKGGGYRNRISVPRYTSWVSSDNENMDFFGSAGQTFPRGIGEGCLNVGESLNNATSLTATRRAFASYHEALNFEKGLVINYPFQEPISTSPTGSPEGGGMLNTSDLYLGGLFRFDRFTGMKLVNSHAGAFIKSPFKDGFPFTNIGGNPSSNRHFSFAGAIYDVNGLWTTPGTYMIQNDTFLTYGAAGLVNVPPADHAKGTTTRYCSMSIVDVDNGLGTNPGTGQFVVPLNGSRLDGSNATVGTWNIPDGAISGVLGWMRYFSLAVNGGRYKIELPTLLPSSSISIGLGNAAEATDSFLLGISWNGSVPVGSAFIKAGGYFGPGVPTAPTGGEIAVNKGRILTSAANLAAVEAGSGNLYWQDTGNNLVWIKYVGGLTDLDSWGYVLDPDRAFMKPMNIGIKA